MRQTPTRGNMGIGAKTVEQEVVTNYNLTKNIWCAVEDYMIGKGIKNEDKAVEQVVAILKASGIDNPNR